MGRMCVVPSCSSRIGSNNNVSEGQILSFHEFPSDAALKEAWLMNISRGQLENAKHPLTPKNAQDVVCSRHFHEDDFRTDVKRRILKKFAVPTIFSNYPSFKRPSVAQRKSPRKRTCLEKTNRTENQQLPPQNAVDFHEDKIDVSVQANVEDFHEDKIDASVQVKMPLPDVRNWRRLQKKYCAQIRRLRIKVSELESQLSEKPKNERCSKVELLEETASEGNTKAIILLDQIDAFGKIRHRWSEVMIRKCAAWRSKSLEAYKMACRSSVMSLPSNSTLKRYIGPSTLKEAVAPLIETRLEEEINPLSPPHATSPGGSEGPSTNNFLDNILEGQLTNPPEAQAAISPYIVHLL